MVADYIEDHIPKYLTAGQQTELVAALRDFENRPYYLNLDATDVLQGDGWSALEIINIEDGRRAKIKGILLSNSCDISAENRRDTPPRLVFAPLVPLDSYVRLLRQASLDENRVTAKLASIRQQKVSSIFYLPRNEALGEEHIALLDDIHSLPFRRFDTEQDRQRLFTLSQMGFYLFVLKLSIHFCRFQENLVR